MTIGESMKQINSKMDFLMIPSAGARGVGGRPIRYQPPSIMGDDGVQFDHMQQTHGRASKIGRQQQIAAMNADMNQDDDDDEDGHRDKSFHADDGMQLFCRLSAHPQDSAYVFACACRRASKEGSYTSQVSGRQSGSASLLPPLSIGLTAVFVAKVRRPVAQAQGAEPCRPACFP